MNPKRIDLKYQIKRTIEEFSFCKIFGVLGLAPRIKNALGFDIVVFKKGIAFVMEMCEHPHAINK